MRSGLALASGAAASLLSRPMIWALLPCALLLCVLALAACSQGVDRQPTVSEDVEGSRGESLTIGMLSTDLAVGENRVAFGILRHERQGQGALSVEVQTFFLPNDASGEPHQTAQASFRAWPGASQVGTHVVSLDFDEPGDWGLRVSVEYPDDGPDGSTAMGSARVSVEETSSTPAIGSLAPRSMNKTLESVGSLSELTTDEEPEPELYRKTVAQAIDESEPLLVTFATPSFCSTATCGPQVDVVKELRDSYADRMNFIHIEVYDNPSQIMEEGIDAARVVPEVEEWGLPSEPWSFVIDAEGIVRAKYEGFVNADELEIAIEGVLP